MNRYDKDNDNPSVLPVTIINESHFEMALENDLKSYSNNIIFLFCSDFILTYK